jgi:serine/threonine-protein kinase RsbW
VNDVASAVDPSANEACVTIANGPLVGPVLGRVVGMLAARADFPIDRLDDALLVADAVAAKAGSFAANGRINVRVVSQIGSVELHVGPLLANGARDLIASAALPGIGNVLERVADELTSEQRAGDDDTEYLRIRLGFDTRRQSTIDRIGSDAS